MSATPHHQAPGFFPGTQACEQVLGDDTPTDPFALARAWLPTDEDPERPVVTLATVDAEGWPNARTVLLSAWDERGFRIHTDARSRKAAELVAVPRAALVVRWPELARQLVVQGTVERDDDDGTAAAFARRDPYLQVLAHVSTAEYARLAAADREAQWSQAVGTRFADGVPQPPTWVGFRVRPRRLTYWAGSTTMASRRVEFALGDDGTWGRDVLPG